MRHHTVMKTYMAFIKIGMSTTEYFLISMKETN